ncbi:MAG: sugar ABC transporter substrate-binding protein [Geminicoccaceae bacterium]
MRTLMLSLLTGTALTLGAAAARADVTLLFWPGPESEAMQKVIDAYNDGPGKADNNKVNQLLFSRQGYFDKEIADLAAGSKEFDLALVTTYTLGRYAPFLSPIDGYLDPGVKERFAGVALDSLAYDGKQFGVPTDISIHFLYYRKDLIEQLLSDAAWKQRYGEISEQHLGKKLEPKAPDQWTWEDFAAAALFFTKSINPDSPTRYGTVLEMKNLIFNIMIWQATLVSNGGDWLDADGKPAIDSDAARKGLELYKKLLDLGATPADSINYEYAEANQAFGSGQAATMLQWNAAFNELNDPAKNPTVAGKVWVGPMPAGSEGHKTHIHSLGIGLNAASDNKDDAGKFLKFLASQEAMEVYGKAGGTPPVPAILDAMSATRPEFKLVGEHAASNAFVVRGGTSAQAVPIYEVLAQNFSGYWAGQLDLDTALKNATAGMAEKLAAQ